MTRLTTRTARRKNAPPPERDARPIVFIETPDPDGARMDAVLAQLLEAGQSPDEEPTP